jgi:hypothetical protein
MINLHQVQGYMAAAKPKPCKQCGSSFTPSIYRLGASVCSPMCAKKLVTANKKAEREQTKERKEAVKTVTELKAEAQKEVNAYVRARDHGKPCISCGKPWQETFQAGHYRSRGAAGHLALDVRNIHGQCVQCNLHRHGNAIDFRLGLIGRYGISHVEVLEADNEPIKLDRDTLRQIKTIYRAKTRQLKKEES